MSRQNGCSYEKGSLLGKDIPSVGMLAGLLLALTWRAASALLGLASLPSTSWCGLCRQPDWSPYWLGARAHVPGDCSWSLQGRVPNSAASSTLGSLKGFFCHQWSRAAICWLVLGGPWKACSLPHKSANLLPEGSQKHLLSLLVFLSALKEACGHSCRAPVEVGLWIHNAIGRWAYQAKKEEEEQINVVLFVTKN